MPNTPPIERISADDLMSLASSSRTPPLVGVVILLGDTATLEPARWRAMLEGRLPSAPRLRQRLERAPPGGGRPIWVDDPDFRLSDHISVRRSPAPAGMDAVLEAATALLTTPLPPNRALWAAVLLTDLEGNRAALIVVLHHVLADGAAGLRLLTGLMDGAPEPLTVHVPRPSASRPRPRDGGARDRPWAVCEFPAALAGVVRTVAQFAPALWTRLAPSSLNRPTGPRRRLVTLSVGLAGLGHVAHRHGASVNDALLSAVTGSLRCLLAGRGEQMDRFVLSVPISFRRGAAGQALGNQSAVVPVSLPATGAPGERLEAVARLMGVAKRTPPGASNTLLRPLFRLLSRLGLYQRFIDHQRLIHTFVTHVRGPIQPLSLGGHPVLELIPLATAGGNITVSFTALSYAGRLTVSLLADPDTCPDLGELRDFLSAELEALTCLEGAADRAPALSPSAPDSAAHP